jgi:hypothetical protein
MKARILVAGLLACGCASFRGYRKQTLLTAMLPADCVRRSIAEVPDVRVADEHVSPDRVGFGWQVPGLKPGAVTVVDRWRTYDPGEQTPRGRLDVRRVDGKIMLVLEAGWPDYCGPDELRQALALADEIYDRLRANCPEVPERAALEVRRVQACD